MMCGIILPLHLNVHGMVQHEILSLIQQPCTDINLTGNTVRVEALKMASYSSSSSSSSNVPVLQMLYLHVSGKEHYTVCSDHCVPECTVLLCLLLTVHFHYFSLLSSLFTASQEDGVTFSQLTAPVHLVHTFLAIHYTLSLSAYLSRYSLHTFT